VVIGKVPYRAGEDGVVYVRQLQQRLDEFLVEHFWRFVFFGFGKQPAVVVVVVVQSRVTVAIFRFAVPSDAVAAVAVPSFLPSRAIRD